MAVRVGSRNRFIADADDFDQSLYRRQAPQSLASVFEEPAKEEKKEGKGEGGEGKEGEGEEKKEEDPEWLKMQAEQEIRDQKDAVAAEKMKILKQIGVHDVDPKSPKYGHPVFKAYMKKYLPYQIEQKELGKIWVNDWHLIDNPKDNVFDVNPDEQGDKAQEGYLPIKEDYDEINYAKSIGRGPGWELAKKHRDHLTKQFKEEEARREAEAAAAAAAEGGEEGKEGEGGGDAKEGGGDAKEEKKEEKKALVQSQSGDAEPTNFVVEPIADVTHYN